MRASKLLKRDHHAWGPQAWQGILTREDAELVAGDLACEFANKAPRGGVRHQRLMAVIVRAMKAGEAFIAEEEARTLMSAFRLAHASPMEHVSEVEVLDTGVKVFPRRKRKGNLIGAFMRTFDGNDLFKVGEVAV